MQSFKFNQCLKILFFRLPTSLTGLQKPWPSTENKSTRSCDLIQLQNHFKYTFKKPCILENMDITRTCTQNISFVQGQRVKLYEQAEWQSK